MLSIYINRLGLVSHLHGCLFNYITIYQGSWAGVTALHMEFGWHGTVVVSACCSEHRLPGCRCTVKRSCAPLGHFLAVYIGVYCYL